MGYCHFTPLVCMCPNDSDALQFVLAADFWALFHPKKAKEESNLVSLLRKKHVLNIPLP